MIVHIWLPVCVCTTETAVRIYPKRTTEKKNFVPKGVVLPMRCMYVSGVNVNIPGFFFFLSLAQITLKTERLRIEESCGGWVVCRSGMVNSNHGGHSLCPPSIKSCLFFRSFASQTARSRGRRGHANQALFFGVVLSFSWRSVSYSSDMGSRPVPQKLRFNCCRFVSTLFIANGVRLAGKCSWDWVPGRSCCRLSIPADMNGREKIECLNFMSFAGRLDFGGKKT